MDAKSKDRRAKSGGRRAEEDALRAAKEILNGDVLAMTKVRDEALRNLAWETKGRDEDRRTAAKVMLEQAHATNRLKRELAAESDRAAALQAEVLDLRHALTASRRMHEWSGVGLRPTGAGTNGGGE